MTISMPPASAGFAARGAWLINDLCLQFGLTRDQAAGIVGNLGYESGGLAVLQERAPTVPGSRGGTGWAMWTASRRRIFETWCADVRLDPSSDDANYGFLIVELTGSYKGVITALKKTTTLYDAVALVEKRYESPAESRVEDRLIWAQKALSGVGKATPAPEPTEPPAEADVYVEDLYNSAVLAAQALQSLLKALGLYQGEVDGIFGPQSSSAAMQAWRLSKGST